MNEVHHAGAQPALLMVGARVVSVAIGLLALPVLIRYLGGSGFAAWAILLALSAAFSLCDFGMGPAMVRFVALAAHANDPASARRAVGHAWILLALGYALGLAGMLLFADRAAAWLKLPESGIFTAEETMLGVFGAVAIRAFLQSGTMILIATRRFFGASAVSLLQPLCSNVAAMAAAWLTGRLDLTLIAFWAAQLIVVSLGFLLTLRWSMPSLGAQGMSVAQLREIGRYGFASQMEGWAHFVNFQFDKFIVAGFVGLWAVAPYEVANRAATALRSVPASAAETFISTAVSRRTREDAWNWYISSTRIAAYGVVVFLVAPLTVAPIFLYAWTGEMGYVGRWVFMALMFGAMANVLALPAMVLAQAHGQARLQVRAAALAVLVNITFSLLMVNLWGVVGAAIGTAAAMFASAAQLTVAVHKFELRPLGPTLGLLREFWPPLLLCLCWAALAYMVFGVWFAALEPAVRFSRVTRTYPGLVAFATYLVCLASILLTEILRGALTLERIAAIAASSGVRFLSIRESRESPH